MIFLLAFFISFFGLLYASYSDFKERIVSNKLVSFMFFSGLILQFVYSFLSNNFFYFVVVLGIVFLTFVVCYFLWILGVWAGGDVKLFTALSALNPFNLFIFSSFVSPFILSNFPNFSNLFVISSVPFFVSLLIFSIFAMFPYGILIGVLGLFKNSVIRKDFIFSVRSKLFSSILFSFVIVGSYVLLSFFNLSLLFSIFLFLGYGFVPKKFKLPVSLLFFLFVLLDSIFVSSIFSLLNIFYSFLSIFIFLFFISLFSFSKKALVYSKNISDLEEGDIIAESLIKTDKGYDFFVPSLKRTFKYFKNHKPNDLDNNILISSRSARGLSLEELSMLNDLSKKKLIKSSILVKKSAPFVPAILIAYVVLNLVGDLFWVILGI